MYNPTATIAYPVTNLDATWCMCEISGLWLWHS